MHLSQLQPQTKHTKYEHEFAFTIGAGSDGDGLNAGVRVDHKTFSVLEGTTMEVGIVGTCLKLNNVTFV